MKVSHSLQNLGRDNINDASGPGQGGEAPPKLDMEALHSQFGVRYENGTKAALARGDFERRMQSLAQDPAGFHELIATAFGPNDKLAAEGLRQAALAGDFSWLPNVEFVSASSLKGANGAYDAQSGTVYLNQDIQNIDTLAATFAEEVGHHMDTLLRESDAAGDEGEVFRRLLRGEVLSNTDLATLRAEDDKGTITINGRQVEVEFFNPLKVISDGASALGGAIADGASALGGVVADGVKAAGGAIVDGASGVGSFISDGVSTLSGVIVDGVSTVGSWMGSAAVAIAGAVANSASSMFDAVLQAGVDAWDVIKFLGNGAWEMTAGALMELFKGNLEEAWERFSGGVDDVVFKLPGRVLDRVLDMSERATGAVIDLIPHEGTRHLVRGELARGQDAARTIVSGVHDAAVGSVRNSLESAADLGAGFGQMVTGDFVGGAERVGRGLVKPFQTVADAGLMILTKGASAVQTVLHLEQPGRELSAAEIQQARAVFGDSIDYSLVRVKEGDAGLFSLNDDPFVSGNTIYLKNAVDMPRRIHELTHVWQHQNGGTDYQSEAIAARVTDGRLAAYDRRRELPGAAWSDLNPEQQAALIEDALVSGAFNSNPPAFPTRMPVPPGMTLAELNQFLQSAVAQLRAGEGAT